MSVDPKQLRIVYMGTPDFAVAPLQALVEGGYRVVAVVTMPDKPAGRGLKVQESAVKRYAVSAGLPVLQPERLKDEAFVAALHDLQPDLGIVVAFRMLPRVVFELPKYGTFNLHASLLPQYRGAAPINWAIINGERERRPSCSIRGWTRGRLSTVGRWPSCRRTTSARCMTS